MRRGLDTKCHAAYQRHPRRAPTRQTQGVAMNRRRLAGLAAAASIGLGTLIGLPASPAFAATCSGNGCNGLDPIATGCATGAYTVASAPMSDPYGTAATIDLRYSPSCGTNWSRLTMSVGTGNSATI